MSSKTTNETQAGKVNIPRSDAIYECDGATILSSCPDILTLEQTCVVLQIGLTTGRSLCRQNKLPAIKIGGLWRIPKVHLEAYLND